MKNFFTVNFLFLALLVNAQVSTDGVKVISEGDKQALMNGVSETDYKTELRKVNQPHESSILEVYSHTQGMLFPRVHYAQLELISDPSDGLTVFVDDGAAEQIGFYVYMDGLGWKKLSEEEEIVSLPNGGVIMYYGKVDDFDETGLGKVGSMHEGWAICNGNNGTPDLRSMFVVMAVDPEVFTPCNNPEDPDCQISDPESLYGYGSDNSNGRNFVMTEQHLPRHTHDLDPVSINASHTHNVVEEDPHVHYRKTSSSNNKKLNGHFRRRTGGQLRRHPAGEFRYGPSTVPIGEGDISDASIDIKFDIAEDIFEDAGNSEPIENRPSYMVLLYIMKVNFDNKNKTYVEYKESKTF